MRRALPVVISSLVTAGLLLAGGPPVSARQAADPAASLYTSVSPVRVLDTRTGAGPVGPGGTVKLDLSSRVPANATAVVLNVTGVAPTAGTFVTVYPSDISRPNASNLNVAPGDTRPIQVTVSLGDSKSVSLFNNAGNIHLLADLTGYYALADGAKFTALAPFRVLDTRQTNNPPGPRGTRILDLTNRIPASATAVTFNLTGIAQTNDTYVTAFPTGGAVPNASNLNLPAADTRANLVTVAVGADRKVSLYNNAGTTNLIADLTGFYTPDYGASFVPLLPTRVLDTRTGTGGTNHAAAPGEIVPVDLSGAGLPPTSTGVVVNVTAIDASTSTFVTAWPQFEDRPASSNINLNARQTVPNAAVVAFGRAPGIELYNNAGTVHLVADLAGVFAETEPACTADCVLAWGDNASRKLGTGETVFDSGTPTQVAGLSGAKAVDGGGYENGYALMADGTVRAWGNNDSGQLGNGWTSGGTGGGSAVPVPVLGLSNVTAIAAGGASAYALRADGTVWAWGSGSLGLLGNGRTDDSSLPVQVSGLTGVVSIANTGSAGYAARRDGTVWAWGYNGAGALGAGTTADHAETPIQVTGLSGVTEVAGGGNGAYALDGDGNVWAWGNNAEGQLGTDSTVTQSTTPAKVSGLTRVTAIAGGQYNGYAVRSDGTVWAWGAGSDGANGNNADCGTTDFPCAARKPVQVSDLSDATDVASFSYGGYALRANGSIAAWGFNGSQSLANESVYWESLVPVPAVGVDGATAIGGGEYSGFAVVTRP
jgi:alpha-tubulin suppressor-like RCC1 family protein